MVSTRILLPGLQETLKKLGYCALFPLAFLGGPTGSPDVPGSGRPTAPHVVSWLTTQRHDFGDLPAGKPVVHVFRFKNVSPDTISLQTVRTTCGCTAVRYPEAPVPPGAIGDITVEYDAAKSGHFHKKIRVFFDRQRKPELLYISGEVE